MYLALALSCFSLMKFSCELFFFKVLSALFLFLMASLIFSFHHGTLGFLKFALLSIVFCAIDVICVLNFCVASSMFDQSLSPISLDSSSSRSVNNFQFGFFRFHLCIWLYLASVCLVYNLMFIGRWSLLYISFSTSHSSLERWRVYSVRDLCSKIFHWLNLCG